MRDPENLVGPSCRCGLKKNPTQIGFGKDDGKCYRHPEKDSDENRDNGETA